MTDDEKRRLMTPSGRLGPTPFVTAPANPPTALSETGGVVALAMPKLDSPVVQLNNQFTFPWQRTLVNMTRVAQGTGVAPGTYTSVTVNAYGQVTHGTHAITLMDAPHDNNVYGRKNGQWVILGT